MDWITIITPEFIMVKSSPWELNLTAEIKENKVQTNLKKKKEKPAKH